MRLPLIYKPSLYVQNYETAGTSDNADFSFGTLAKETRDADVRLLTITQKTGGEKNKVVLFWCRPSIPENQVLSSFNFRENNNNTA